MSHYAHLAYTRTVRKVQEENGSSRAANRQLAANDGPDLLTASEAAFIEARDGFYLASVSETG